MTKPVGVANLASSVGILVEPELASTCRALRSAPDSSPGLVTVRWRFWPVRALGSMLTKSSSWVALLTSAELVVEFVLASVTPPNSKVAVAPVTKFVPSTVMTVIWPASTVTGLMEVTVGVAAQLAVAKARQE